MNIEDAIKREIEYLSNPMDRESVIGNCLSDRMKITSKNLNSGNASVIAAIKSIFRQDGNVYNVAKIISKIREKNAISSNFILFMICRMVSEESDVN